MPIIRSSFFRAALARTAILSIVVAAVGACDAENAAGSGEYGALAGAPAAAPAPATATTASTGPVAPRTPAAVSGSPAPAPSASAPGASPAPAGTTPAATSTTPPAGTAPVAVGPAMKVSIVVPAVAAGQEGTECLQVKLSNAAPIDIVQLHNRLSAASHHFIVTALTDPAAVEKPRAACMPFRGAIAGAPLAITQKHDDMISLPQGVGYHFNANQVVHLELHYLNASDKTVDVSGEAELVAADPSLKLQQGAVLLVGTTDINIPAHMTHQNQPKFLALPQGMDGVQFYAMTGHTHRLGTNVTVSSATNATTPGPQLYAPANYDWEAPEMKSLTPHATIPAGGGFMLQCSWNNTTDAAVSFGESALNEMCFFWAYYYPRKNVTSIVLDNVSPDALKHF
jgi:hypothetical protein